MKRDLTHRAEMQGGMRSCSAYSIHNPPSRTCNPSLKFRPSKNRVPPAVSKMNRLNDLLKQDINDPIDPQEVTEILAHLPFIQVDGLINARDLNDGSLKGMKKGFAYRSGSLEVMTSAGRDQLKALGLKTMIDLRSAEELVAFSNPEIQGIAVMATNMNRDWNRNEGETGAGRVGGNEVCRSGLAGIPTAW